jgi:hypothetical protein
MADTAAKPVRVFISYSHFVGVGKLKSTDGYYGLRFAHNTDVLVTGFAMSKD